MTRYCANFTRAGYSLSVEKDSPKENHGLVSYSIDIICWVETANHALRYHNIHCNSHQEINDNKKAQSKAKHYLLILIHLLISCPNFQGLDRYMQAHMSRMWRRSVHGTLHTLPMGNTIMIYSNVQLSLLGLFGWVIFKSERPDAGVLGLWPETPSRGSWPPCWGPFRSEAACGCLFWSEHYFIWLAESQSSSI